VRNRLSFLCLCASLVLLLPSCHKATENELKEKIVGRWREVRTKNEFIDFNAEGAVLMQSPGTSETCEYDFPDPRHLRLNCAPQGAPQNTLAINFCRFRGSLGITHTLGYFVPRLRR
jgi:hypothetical protein